MGTLDFILIKPVDSQFMVSTRHIQVPQLGQAILGLVVLGVGLFELGEQMTAAAALAFAVTLVCGLVLVYCLLLVLSTFSFWFVRVENLLAIFWSFLDAGRFPRRCVPRLAAHHAQHGRAHRHRRHHSCPGDCPADSKRLVCWRCSPGRSACGGLPGWFWRRGLRSYTGASA